MFTLSVSLTLSPQGSEQLLPTDAVVLLTLASPSYQTALQSLLVDINAWHSRFMQTHAGFSGSVSLIAHVEHSPYCDLDVEFIVRSIVIIPVRSSMLWPTAWLACWSMICLQQSMPLCCRCCYYSFSSALNRCLCHHQGNLLGSSIHG
jgi:hypothetical protein